ncbi:ChbG/HpnK family deacetylase [Occallatibacter riparius]|uniref:ChbG/HpnK family deacetylase n=1 Tax=Occallatibacter riparius TaxID=1002689 RepID=A0A9J7BMP2_9BACT|nr:ChbG/HpnK family deacetylase [Occallatibacter riparius]UWZ82461.1 ChbG/HpnK family deacetylase [Occallatibacter riparius]
MPRIIVNADDFGLTSGVNRAVLELHQAGVLTSATVMARAAATDEAIEIAKATPSLGVGCHVVLVDGEPILSAAHDIPNISSTVQQRFEPTLGSLLRSIYQQGASGKVDYQIEIEARAQIHSLQARGIRLTHIDTHKHTHMFPRVLRPVLRAARACGIRAVRNPFEPSWSVRATPGAPLVRRMQVRALRLMEATFRRIVTEEGFTTTEGALGVLATGTLDGRGVASLLNALPCAGTFELVTHPGYNDAELAHANTRLLSSREIERDALLSLRQQARPVRCLISFAEL